MGKKATVVTGDDLIHFPTPTEAFGIRNQDQSQQQRPIRKAPLNQPIQGQRNATPPLHPQQPIQQHPRQRQQPQQQHTTMQQMQQMQQPQRYTNQPRPASPQMRSQGPPQIPLQQNHSPRPSLSGFPRSQQSSYVDNSSQSQYSGYAPSAYEHLQQRSNQQIPQQQSQPPAADPAQILERQLRELFDRVDRSRDGRLREDELATALINNDGTQFKPSTVKLMVRLFDKDGSGAIEFKEFFHLWNYILHWRKTFQRYDIDGNQKISFGEYQAALESFGYRLPTDIVLFIFQRFGEFNNSKPMSLKFDMFVESLVWLLRCTNVFKKFDTQGNGIATISFQDFVHEILSFI